VTGGATTPRSGNASNYQPDDATTSWNNYQFLLNFFEVFTSFKGNPLYITGESYGGTGQAPRRLASGSSRRG
jgi:carboxypeptidase C (cathepsin A)